MKLKPNILDECARRAIARYLQCALFSRSNSVIRYAGRSSTSKSLSGPLVSDRCPRHAQASGPINLILACSDTVVIEDESGRIQLKGTSVRTLDYPVSYACVTVTHPCRLMLPSCAPAQSLQVRRRLKLPLSIALVLSVVCNALS